jgi:hypothetical protein
MENDYANRTSYFEIVENRSNENLQLGYDYQETLMEKSLSNYFFGDTKRINIIKEFNSLMVYLIDSVKNVKKTFVYSVPRNSRNIN